MSMDYLKDMPIAVLGAGGVGKTSAADMALAGKEVRIWDQADFASKTLAYIDRGLKLEGTQLNLYGYERSGVAKVAMATTDMAEAVNGAGQILVAVVGLAHEKVLGELAPLLKDGQVVHIIPDNGGTLLLRKYMRECGNNAKVIIGGWATAPYGTRIIIEGGIITNRCDCRDRVIMIRGAALPACDTPDFIESAKLLPCWDAVTEGMGYQEGDTVIDNLFSNANPVIHVPGVVLGISTLQNFEKILDHDMSTFSMYAHCLCPAIANVQGEFYMEEMRIAEAMNVGIMPLKPEDFQWRSSMYGFEYMGPDYKRPFDQKYPNKYGDGPFSLENRYVTEDVPIGCCIFQELGDRYGVDTPMIDAMIDLACVMIGRDLKAERRTLDFFDIGHMTHDEMQKYLREGVYTPKK